MELNKNYTKMGGTDDPGTIDEKNQTQMTEVEADMATIESEVTQAQTDILSKADQASLNTHTANTANPHSVTAEQAGLGNVPNVDATDCDNHTSGTTNKVFTATEQNKLSGTEDNATADQTGAEIKAIYEAEADTNNYSDSEKAKLGSIDATHYLPPLADLTALAALTGMTDKARCYVESEITDYFYDKQATSGDVEAPVADGGWWKKVVSSGETAASIKTKYESNADTNAYTDAEKTKVGAIESGATADQSDAEIETAYNNQVGAASQAEAEAGTETGIRRFSPLRIFQAIKAWIVDSGGWITYSGTMPTIVSTVSGVDKLAIADSDTFLMKGAKVQLTSGAGTHNYYVRGQDSANLWLAGETSPTGIITAMRYSYADCPFGFKKGEDWFKARTYRTSDKSLAVNTWTKVGVSTTSYDPNGNVDYTTTYRWDCPLTATYDISGQVEISGVAEGTTLVIAIYKNDTLISYGSKTGYYTGTAANVDTNVIDNLELNRDDYIEFYCYLTASTARDIKSGESKSYGTIRFTGI